MTLAQCAHYCHLYRFVCIFLFVIIVPPFFCFGICFIMLFSLMFLPLSFCRKLNGIMTVVAGQ